MRSQDKMDEGRDLIIVVEYVSPPGLAGLFQERFPRQAGKGYGHLFFDFLYDCQVRHVHSIWVGLFLWNKFLVSHLCTRSIL